MSEDIGTIAIIPTTSGNFNIFGTQDDLFFLQGNLSKEQLELLHRESENALLGLPPVGDSDE